MLTALINLHTNLGNPIGSQMIYGTGRIKFAVMLAVLLAHVLVLLGLNRNSAVSSAVNQPAIVLKLIAPQLQKIPIELPHQLLLDNNSGAPHISLKLPEFSIAPADVREANSVAVQPGSGGKEPAGKSPLPAGNAIFDPRLRQTLRQQEMAAKTTREESLTSWTTANGRKYVDMGDGTCIHTMGKIDGERQAQWSSTRSRCGRSWGEKMLDNVQQTLNNRN